MSDFAFKTLREQIVSAIRTKILSGELTPGTRIIEQKLAEEFGSSRGPIREALRQLEQEGLVEYSRNVGCSAKKVSVNDAYEIYLLRSSLETAAIRHYDCEFTDEDFAAMKAVLDDMLKIPAGSINEIVACDNRFHEIIVRKAGLPRLMKSWEELNYGSLIAGAFSGSYEEQLAQRQNIIHTQLMEVLMLRDIEKACKAVHDHYMCPVEKVMKEMQEG